MTCLEEPTKYQERGSCLEINASHGRQVHFGRMGEGDRMSSAPEDCRKASEWKDISSITAFDVQ